MTALSHFLQQKTIRKNPINPNLCSANIATGTNALGTTGGFGAYNGGSIDTTTSEYYVGTRSLKVNTPGSTNYEGCSFSVTVANGVGYRVRSFIKAPNGASMKLWVISAGNSNSTAFTGNGDWQEITSTVTSSGTTIEVYPTKSTPEATEFYVGKNIVRVGY